MLYSVFKTVMNYTRMLHIFLLMRSNFLLRSKNLFDIDDINFFIPFFKIHYNYVAYYFI